MRSSVRSRLAPPGTLARGRLAIILPYPMQFFISFGIEAHERIVAVDEGPPLQKRPAFRYLTL
jgi:hypothetical protein